MKRYLTQMHLHAGHESCSSIRSHASEAQKAGYDVLFITEHDTRMNYQENALTDFHLSVDGDAVTNDKYTAGFFCGEMPAKATLHKGQIAVELKPNTKTDFICKKKKHQASLLSGFSLVLEADIPSDGVLDVDIELSQDEKLEKRHLFYHIGKENDDLPWHFCCGRNESGIYVLRIYEAALLSDIEFGLDNAFLSFSLTQNGDKPAYIFGFRTERNYSAQAQHLRQQTLAEKIGQHFGMKIYASFESSIAHHYNCYTKDIPILNYDQIGYVETDRTAPELFSKCNITFSYNHMFWHNAGRSADEIADMLCLTKCNGAKLLEVGFPCGRDGHPINDYLYVWDKLAMNGIRAIGYGDSDSHDSRAGWKDGNNFGTWICAKDDSWDSLEKALLKGNVCFGDPYKWKADWEISINGHQIGETIKSASDEKLLLNVRFTGLCESCQIRVISSGNNVFEEIISGNTYQKELTVSRGNNKYAPIRIEVVDADGRYIFLSNPITLAE